MIGRKCQRCRRKRQRYGWFGMWLCNPCIVAILTGLDRLDVNMDSFIKETSHDC